MKKYYERLKLYLAINKKGVEVDRIYEAYKKLPMHYSGVINEKTGKYYPVMWMPRLDKKNWRRLKYDEFVAYYKRGYVYAG